jgi:photosystem II stability/assembly factor-like uncharacterized protein
MKSITIFLFVPTLILLLFVNRNTMAQNLWSRQSSGTSADLYSIYFLNDSVGYVVGDSGTLLMTRDAGTTWTKRSVGDYTLRAVQFLDSATGYTVGYGDSGGVILKTTDGGSKWDTITTKANGLCLALHFMNEDTGLVVGYGHFIVKTTDGGNTWLDLSHVVGTSIYINDVYFLNDSVGFLAAGDCGPGFPCPDQVDYLGQIRKTMDGGNTWPGGFGTFGSFSSVTFANDSTGFAVGLWGAFKRTADAGTTWDGLGANPFYHFNEYELWRVDFMSPDTGWLVGTSDSLGRIGFIASTVDGAYHWTEEDSVTTGGVHDVFLYGRRHMWAVGGGGTILRRSGTTPVKVPSNLPEKFSLNQNYPNPFNPSTVITYQLTMNSQVSLKIYDILGREVKTLADEEETAGQHAVLWEGTDYDGRQVASGVYYYRLITPSGSITKKAVLIR